MTLLLEQADFDFIKSKAQEFPRSTSFREITFYKENCQVAHVCSKRTSKTCLHQYRHLLCASGTRFEVGY